MTVDVVHYIRPNGRQKLATTELSDDLAQKYKEMTEANCRFTAEVSFLGVSICIEQPCLGDFDSMITANGPAVQAGMETMLARFSSAKLKNWKKHMES